MRMMPQKSVDANEGIRLVQPKFKKAHPYWMFSSNSNESDGQLSCLGDDHYSSGKFTV